MYIPYRPGTRVKVSSIYGEKRGGEIHKGIDLMGQNGEKNLYAIFPGVVEHAGWEDATDPTQGFGLYLRIRITEGLYTDYRLYYGHCSQINVQAGDWIQVGDFIAVEGATGTALDSHCHLEIRNPDGVSLNISSIAKIPNQYGLFDVPAITFIKPRNESQTCIRIGSKVKVTGVRYATGEKIPAYIKVKTHTVQRFDQTKKKAQLREIDRWVRVKDLKLL